jgi:hypothetical protein
MDETGMFFNMTDEEALEVAEELSEVARTIQTEIGAEYE